MIYNYNYTHIKGTCIKQKYYNNKHYTTPYFKVILMTMSNMLLFDDTIRMIQKSLAIARGYKKDPKNYKDSLEYQLNQLRLHFETNQSKFRYKSFKTEYTPKLL